MDTSYGQTYDTCRQIGLKAGARPDSMPLQGPSFYLAYKNSVPRDARAAAIAFYDGAGQEVYRYTLIAPETAPSYYVNYPSGYDTALGMTLNTSALGVQQKAAIARAESVRVLVNFSKGIETFAITKSKSPNLQ